MNKKVLLLIGALSGTSFAAHASLLTNSSFELPAPVNWTSLSGGSTAISGWTTTLSGVEWFSAASWSGGAADGVMAVDLANYVYTGGGIKQTFATTPGENYTVSFSAGNYLGFGRDGTGMVEVDVAGQHFAFETAVAKSASNVWKSISFNFVALTNETTLMFSNNQNPYAHFAYIDNVSVNVKTVNSTVPEPAPWALMCIGLVAAILRRRRV